MAAAAFQLDELGLEKEEATQLAKAIADVADFYPMDVDPKAMAWVSLGVAVAMVEGPRAWFLMKRAQAAKAAAAKAPSKPPTPNVPAAGGITRPTTAKGAQPSPTTTFPEFSSGQG